MTDNSEIFKQMMMNTLQSPNFNHLNGLREYEVILPKLKLSAGIQFALDYFRNIEKLVFFIADNCVRGTINDEHSVITKLIWVITDSNPGFKTISAFSLEESSPERGIEKGVLCKLPISGNELDTVPDNFTICSNFVDRENCYLLFLPCEDRDNLLIQDMNCSLHKIYSAE